MTKNVLNARVTFRDSPIHVLERFTFKDIDNAYDLFKKYSELEECVIIQTCNRIELFATAENFDINKIKKTWASLAGLEENAFKEHFQICDDKEVFDHLLKLTSGLDSLVVGEEQVLGQVKDSITKARDRRSSGKHLNTLFDKAIRIGTRIRNSTGISKGGISVGSMAVKLAEESIDNIKSKKVLLIGTGEASAMVAKSLNRRGYEFFVTSRTLQRSKSFSETLGGTPLMFEEILDRLVDYDIVFVATAAPYFLVTHEKIQDSMNSKTNGMMILDLSNPRTVDEKVANIPGVKLMNLDQIAEMVDKNMRNRIGEVSKVEKIINEEVPVLEASMKRLEAEPIVKDVFKNIDSLRERELQKAMSMLGEIGDDKAKIIDELTKAVVECIISTPMNNVRRASEQGNSELVDAAAKMFNYKKEE